MDRGLSPAFGPLTRRFGRRRLMALAGSTGVAALLAACNSRGSGTPAATGTEQSSSSRDDPRPEGWAKATHSKKAPPDYATVFPSDRVNQMTFVLPPGTWEAMLENMTALLGARASANGTGNGWRPLAVDPNSSSGFLPSPPPGPTHDEVREKPDWFPVTVLFNGKRWTHAGLRFKGNSSLRGAWRSGTDSIPFKLDFDQFEDEFPEIRNQRFHGFKQLSLANNYGDRTGMRETIAFDLFERAGLVAAHTAPYEILVDRGSGPVSFGLYTMVEVIDDTVVGRSFRDGSGTVFDADGPAVNLAAGNEGQLAASFSVKDGAPDWSPLQRLLQVLHSGERTTRPAAWRASLEEIFDVDSFLNWLGLSTAMVHWDTYGQMHHNFYLYADPDSGRLTWISWDHNFVLGRSAGRATGPGRGQPPSFDQASITEQWPLIRFLLDDETYRGRYREHLRHTASSVFVAEDLLSEYDRLEGMIAPHVPGDERARFAAAVDELRATTRSREESLAGYLRDV